MQAGESMKLSISIATLAMVVLFGCGSTGQRPTAAPEAVVVPLGDGRCFVFRESGVGVLDENGLNTSEEQVPIGAPTASAADSSSGWGVVIYPHALAVVSLTDSSVKIVGDVVWNRPPRALGINDTTIGTIEDDTIGLYDAAKGERLYREEGRELLERFAMRELLFVQPLSSERMLIVAKRASGIDKPEAAVFDVDRSRGALQGQPHGFADKLHDVHACTGDGRWLFIGGVLMTVERSLNGSMQARHTVRVLRFDVKSGRFDTILQDPQGVGRSAHVRQLRVGFGYLVVWLEDGTITAYDLPGMGIPEKFWEGHASEGLSDIACVDARHLALISGPDVRLLRLPERSRQP